MTFCDTVPHVQWSAASSRWCMSRHFRRSYLKANEVSKSEGTRKVEYAYRFWRCADAVYPTLSKLIHACRYYSLPKLARFSIHSVAWLNALAVAWADTDNAAEMWLLSGSVSEVSSQHQNQLGRPTNLLGVPGSSKGDVKASNGQRFVSSYLVLCTPVYLASQIFTQIYETLIVGNIRVDIAAHDVVDVVGWLVGWLRRCIVTKQLDGSSCRLVSLGQWHVVLEGDRKYGSLWHNYMLV